MSKKRRRVSTGTLVASTNPIKQAAIIASITGLNVAYKNHNIICTALLITMQVYSLNT